jgi:UTP--glucose-1-phosphate uridylyltransferase
MVYLSERNILYLGEKIMKKIRKAVIPAAGLGTRVLPATKAQPKEMLVIVDKPVLQYLVEELIASGIEEILIVTGRNKSSIENHFDYSFELEKTLEEKGKLELLKVVDDISKLASIYYVRQKKPLGLGHAIGCAEAFVGDEPFVIVLGDDIVYTDKAKGELPAIKQLIDKYSELKGGNILGVQKVPEKDVNKYGIIKPLKKIDKRTVEVENFVEKPNLDEAPSRLAALGRYVLEPEIFGYLKNAKPGKGGEIQLTDAILSMKNDVGKLYAYNYEGLRYDTGNKYGMFVANIEFGLRHPELKDKAKKYLKKLIECEI